MKLGAFQSWEVVIVEALLLFFFSFLCLLLVHRSDLEESNSSAIRARDGMAGGQL